jgi:hypothetical protein
MGFGAFWEGAVEMGAGAGDAMAGIGALAGGGAIEETGDSTGFAGAGEGSILREARGAGFIKSAKGTGEEAPGAVVPKAAFTAGAAVRHWL